MTKQEKEDKIADLKKKASNKSLPASAVKKLEGMIEKLESEPVTEEAPKPEPKVEKKEKAKKAKKAKASEDKTESNVFVVFGSNDKPDSMQVSEEKAKAYISRRPLKGKGMTYKEMEEKAAKKLFAKPAADYDCDELIEKEKARKASAKKSAKKADATPTAKKDEKAAEKLGERVKKHYKAGELTKAEIKKIIAELQEQLKELQELLKTAK